LTKQRLGGRLTVSEPQAAQYLYAERLVKMTGRPKHDWPRAVVKELVDNALDAAEMAGVAPEVAVGVDAVDGGVHLSVGDNGAGITPDMVSRALDFGAFSSSKAVYRVPSRGQQGNALKTLIAMPFAMGHKSLRWWQRCCSQAGSRSQPPFTVPRTPIGMNATAPKKPTN
jgi:light-regulated signal transduction histidine kinase (bacteriophytochrome)